MRRLLLPPITVVLCLLLMLLLHRWFPLLHLLAFPARLAGLLPIGVGFAMASWHARLFRRLDTNIDTFGEPGKLVTAGLFGRSRNPMYLGMVVFLAGVATLLGSLTPWLAPILFLLLAQFCYIPLEERAMSAKFGAHYEEYRSRVRRWI